jgi:hypothetical protein
MEDSQLGCPGWQASSLAIRASTGKMPVCRDRLEAYLPLPPFCVRSIKALAARRISSATRASFPFVMSSEVETSLI